MSFADPLKDAYYFFEDRYYGVLDKINQHVPIYKLVDPIDKVFPSFLLLVLALLLFIILFAVMLSIPGAGALTAKLLVLGPGNNPLEGVSILFAMPNGSVDVLTDSWGEAEIGIPLGGLEVEVTFEKEGFDSITETITLGDELIEVTMKKTVAVLEPTKYNIYVVSTETGSQSLIKSRVNISFECGNGAEAPGDIEGRTGQFKNIELTLGCDQLVATVTSAGYTTKQSVPITKTNNYIELVSIQTEGSITVMVKDASGDPVSNATVMLANSDNASVGQKSSDESGVAFFEDIDAGAYSVAALHPDGRKAEKTDQLVRAGRNLLITLTMPELPQGTMILLHLKNSENDSDVANAKVLIYTNNLRTAQQYSDSDGLVEIDMDDDGADLVAVIWHDNYVTKIVPNVDIVEKASGTEQEVELEPITETNNSKIIAKAVDYPNEDPVEGAEVYLYNMSQSQIVLNYPYTPTDSNGTVLFERLPPGNYKAKGVDDETETEGWSNEETLSSGQTLELKMVLVLTEGNVNVTVFDPARGELEEATVNIFNADNDNPLQGGVTDFDGVFESVPIKSNIRFYAEASKENYLSAVSAPHSIIPEDTQELLLELVHKADIDTDKNMIVEFAGFFTDLETEDGATTLESGQTYFLKFYITLPRDADYAGLVHHLRTGPEDVLEFSPSNYVMRIWADEVLSSYDSSTIFSKSFDPSDPFANPDVTNAVAKQANTKWETPGSETRHFVVYKVETEPGLQEDEEVEIRYQAKAQIDGTPFLSAEFLKIFKIGETICMPGGFGSNACPPVVLRFWLQEEGGEKEILNNFDESSAKLLNLKIPYFLSYTIFNTSGAEIDATLEVENKDPSGVFTIDGIDGNYTVFSNIPIEADTIVDTGSPLDLNTVREAAITKFDFRIKENGTIVQGGDESAQKILFFRVQADGNLVITPAQAYLIPFDGGQIVMGTITGPAGEAVQYASVQITAPNGHNETVTSDINGSFRSSKDFALSPGQRVTISASAAKYRDSQIEIPVKASDYFDPRYACIEFEMGGGESLKEFNATPGSTGAFRIVSNCTENVVIEFNTKLDMNPSSSTIAPGQARAFTFIADNPSGSDEVYLGQYPIYVKARFESDVRFLIALKAMVYISDPEGSCFEIDKTSFDIQGQDANGTITNYCPVAFNDAWTPKLALDTFKAEILRTDLEIPELVEFDWTLKAVVRYIDVNRAIVEDLTQGWDEFYVDTDRVNTADQGDFDDIVTIPIGNRMRNIDAIRFNVFHQEVDSCGVAEDIVNIPGGTITVNTLGGQQEVDVPCTDTGCVWDNDDKCIEAQAEGDCSGNLLVMVGYPCAHFEFTVPVDIRHIESLEVPVFNRDNNSELTLDLHGTIVEHVLHEDVNYSDGDIVFGSFHSAIVPVEGLGYALGSVDIDFPVKLQEMGRSIWLVYNVDFVTEASDPAIETWLVDDTVYAKYVGVDIDAVPVLVPNVEQDVNNPAGQDVNNPAGTQANIPEYNLIQPGEFVDIPFIIRNILLNTTQHNLIVVEDFVSEMKP